MQVPKLVKIVLSSGLGDIKDNAKSIQIAQNEMKIICGQQPVLCKAKKGNLHRVFITELSGKGGNNFFFVAFKHSRRVNFFGFCNGFLCCGFLCRGPDS